MQGERRMRLMPKPSEPSWVPGGAYRLKTSVFRSDQIGAALILVVVLHGDAPFNKPDYQNTFAATVAATNRDVVAMGLLLSFITSQPGRHDNGKVRMSIFTLIGGVLLNVAIFGGLLFVPAGTLDWWRAWVFLGVV